MKPNPSVLLIDADKPVRRLLRTLLEPERYKVFEAESGEAGIQEVVARRPDAIILDPCLPDVDGVTVLKRLREWSRSRVLILSERNGEEQKVAALDSGANDYMCKPFGSAELLARLRVLLRPSPTEPDRPVYLNGDLQVDVKGHVTTIRGRRIEFTPTEEALFYMLARHAGQVVPCKHLVRCVWGAQLESKLHDLHVYIRNLRRKLHEATDEILIHTEGSIGYGLLVPFNSQKAPKGVAEPLICEG